MTLIASAQRHSLITLSDIMISGPINPEAQLSGLPVCPSAFNLSTPHHTIYGLCQKTVRLDDRHVLQWAGTRVVAEGVTKGLAELLQSGWDSDLSEALDHVGLTPSESASVSLIYHRWRDGLAFRDQWNAQTRMIDGADTILAGTGAFDFIDATVPSFDMSAPDLSSQFLRSWLARLGTTFLREAYDLATATFAYGGWFELAIFTDSGLTKLPYTITIWSRRGNVLHLLPVFSCWYLDEDLCIATTRVDADPTLSTLNISVVRDFLLRTPPRDADVYRAAFNSSGLQIHLVIDDQDPDQFRFAVVPADVREGLFALDLGDGRVTINANNALTTRLIGALDNASSNAITFPYELG